jgi:hypothetical protein
MPLFCQGNFIFRSIISPLRAVWCELAAVEPEEKFEGISYN